jgi:hypothetical protein
MSLLFTKLNLPVSNWTDTDFTRIYQSRDFVSYLKLFGYSKDIWQRWWAFVERQNPKPDYASPPSWLRFLQFHAVYGPAVEYFYPTAYILDHLNLALPPYKAALEKDAAKRKAREEKELEEWRARRKREKVLIEKGPSSYCMGYSDADLKALDAGAKTLQDCRVTIIERPRTSVDAVVEVVRVYHETGPDIGKLKDIKVETTNYGFTYAPDDILLFNQGKRKLEQCKPIVQEYECPVITINEEVKAEIIKQYNPKTINTHLPWHRLYTRSDEEAYRNRPQPQILGASHFLRRPGTTKPRFGRAIATA